MDRDTNVKRSNSGRPNLQNKNRVYTNTSANPKSSQTKNPLPKSNSNINPPSGASPNETPTSLMLRKNTSPPNVLDDDANRVFSLQKPKHIGAGLSSGIKSAAKGVGMGAASVVGLPVIGAFQDGLSGFVRGLGLGVVAGICLPLAGLGVGIFQTARGVVSTPEAFVEMAKGNRKWDKKARKWIDYWYSLKEDEQKVYEAKEAAKYGNNKEIGANKREVPQLSPERTVVDKTYYDSLQVPVNATPIEIRKAYYRLAMKHHPDKNPGDPAASDKFQKIGEAYQILGQEERRSKYDKYGMEATTEIPIIDSAFFFLMLFGNEALEPYIGKLRMAMIVEDSVYNKHIDIEEQQRWRVVDIACKLRNYINQYVRGDEEDKIQWKNTVQTQANELCKGSSAGDIVDALGWVYVNNAKQFLGKQKGIMNFEVYWARLQSQSRNAGRKINVATALVRTTAAAAKLNVNNKDTDLEESERVKKQKEQMERIEEALPYVVEVMFKITLMDIEDTVKSATKKLLKDMSVSNEIRIKRAEALVVFGTIFQNVASRYKSQSMQLCARERLENAFIRSVEKANDEQVGF